jgi:fibronectin-binding autotransporter adhesin
VQFNPGTAFTNNGAALTINGGITNSARNNVWNIPLTLGASQTIDTAAGTSLTLNGVISGSYGLTFADAGTATLSVANTYTGGSTINGGILVEKVAASGGTGALTVNSGAKVSYQVGGYAQSSYSALNIIGGTFSVDGASQNQVNSVNKPMLMQGGTLTSINGLAGPANDGGFGNYLLNGGTLTVSGSSQSVINATTFQAVNGGSFNVGVTGAGVDLLVASVINGGAIIKNGPGTMVLSGANTYTGATTVGSGALLVNGSLSTGAVTVNSGGTLGGTGRIGGAVTVNGGATLRVTPAATIVGKLTFTSSLTFNSGATNIMGVSRNGGVATNDLLQVSSGLTFAGTLVATNIGTNALMAGDSFKLFSAGTYAGRFTNFILPPLANGLSWNTNLLATNGMLTVVLAPPVIANVNMAADQASFTLTGSGAAGHNYILTAATNLSSPWAPALTNPADGNGVFSFTDLEVTNYPQRFYRVQLQN